jgi:tetratricopeptide (TPR) repeat protein
LALLQDKAVALPEALRESPTGRLLAEAAAIRSQALDEQKRLLADRIACAKDPAFRALLHIDVAVLSHAHADASEACASLVAAIGERSPETWLALVVLEHVLKKGRLSAPLPHEATAARLRAEMLTEAAASEVTRRALGVRSWQIEPARIADAWMWAARAAVVGDSATASHSFECAERWLREANDPMGADAMVWGARAAFEVAGDLDRAGEWGNKRELQGPLREAVASRDVLLAHLHRVEAQPWLDHALSNPAAEAIARAVHFARATGDQTLRGSALAWRAQSEFAPEGAAREAAALASAWFFAVAGDSGEAQASLSRALTCGVSPTQTARLAPALARLANDERWLDTALAAQIDRDPELDPTASSLLRYVRASTSDARAQALDGLGNDDGSTLARILGNLIEGTAAHDWLQTLRAAERSHTGSSDAQLGVELLASLAALRLEADADAVGQVARRYPAAAWLQWTAIAAARGDAKKAADRARFASESCDTEPTEFALTAAMCQLRQGISEAAVRDLRRGAAHPIASLAADLASAWLDPSSRERLAAQLFAPVGSLERFASQLVKGQPLPSLAEAYGSDRELVVAAALGEALFGSEFDRAAEVLVAEGGAAMDLGLWLPTQNRDGSVARESTRAHAAWFAHARSLASARAWLRSAIAGDEDLTAPWNALIDASPASRQSALRAWAPTVAGTGGAPPNDRNPSIDDQMGEAAKLPTAAAARQLGVLGWSLIAEGRIDQAVVAFERAASAFPRETSAWIGLRCASRLCGDTTLVARSCARLGQLTGDAESASTYFEEAGIAFESLGETQLAEACYSSAFDKSPWRGVAFEKLFRVARDQRDAGELLALTSRRLGVADDPDEMLQIYWERARSFRQAGDLFAASEALTNVNMLDEHHLGALALASEIAIKEGRHDDAASALERLATLAEAPLGTRLTAAVAASDLLENKLSQPAKALGLLDRLERTVPLPLALKERQVRLAVLSGAHEAAARGLVLLMRERATLEGRVEAARLALVLYRDKVADDEGVLRALQQLLRDAPTDGEAIDQVLAHECLPIGEWNALLVNSLDGIRESLRTGGHDYVGALRLARLARMLGARATEALGWSLALAMSPTLASGIVDQWTSSAPAPDEASNAVLTPEEMGLLRLDVIASPLGGAYDAVVELFSRNSPATQALPGQARKGAGARLAAATAWELLPVELASDENHLVEVVVGLCRALRIRVEFTDTSAVTEAQRYFETRFTRKERKALAGQLAEAPPLPDVVRLWARRGRIALSKVGLLFSLDYRHVVDGPIDDTADGDAVRALLSATLDRQFVTIAERIWGRHA